MSNRLELHSVQLASKPKIVDSCFDFLHLSSMITPEQNEIRKKVRHFAETQIKQSIIPYIQKAQFPEYLIPKLHALDIAKYHVNKPYGQQGSIALQGLILAELARIEPGVATFWTVQMCLVVYTLQELGSEQQKSKYIPKLANLQMLGGWGLTEPKVGSDASNIQSSATKQNDTYKINGVKRWIGNGNKDLLISWARNTQSKKVQAFVLQTKGLKGWNPVVIKNKLALRIVQNCNIQLTNVQAKQTQKLPLAKDFQSGTNSILKHSRVFVCWIAAGICMGVYDHTIKYASQRIQFGRPISGFQLVQEKLVRMMGNIQGILLLCLRISQMEESGTAKIGQIAMSKAWITERGREVCRLGRQIHGGNGLLHENYVMRAQADMEAVYTYEGTYDINSLVAGRDLTGLAAFTK